MYIWVYTGEINAKRIREKYLQSVLRQDIQFFDEVGAGEVATRIQTDTREFKANLDPLGNNPLVQTWYSKEYQRKLL
jgi:ABC-type multidrug transport system fused ATPase/permease subunit